MNKLGILLRIQLLNAFGINKALHSKDKKDKQKLIGMAVAMVFVGASLLFTLVVYDILYANAFEQIGALQLLPAMMMAVASVITLFTTVYKVNGVLFGSKDYDMTMSLPVRCETVVAAKLIQIYSMNVGFCALIVLPANIIYAIRVMPSAWFYVAMILLTLFVPMVPMIVGMAIGSVITAISSRFRHTNVIAIVLSLAAVVLIMLLSFNSEAMVTNAAQIGATLMGVVNRLYPLTPLYTQALCEGNLLSLLCFILLSVALFGLFSLLTARYYKTINTALLSSRSSSNYKMQELKVSSPLAALYRREMRRLFSSSLYVLNTCIGMILCLIGCIALLFVTPEQMETFLEVPGFTTLIGSLAPLVLAVMIGLSCTTDCAISLEGKELWIIRSLPVDTSMVFKAKILVNLTVTVPPALISALLLCVALPFTPLQIVFLILTPAAYSLFISEFGLLINLLNPNLSWTSEVTVIKQSAAVLITIMVGMFAAIGLCAALLFLPDTAKNLGLAGVTVVIAALDALLARILRTKGVRMFEAL